MAEKVKVSREVSDAINTLETWIGLEKHVSEKVLKIAQLVAYGREVEQTPEERILEYYQRAKWMQEKDAIIFVLETLDINIKGVNAL